ncbi:MAG: hypothetical protein EBT09_06880 [Actinobacteria bacterium]|nr:hypothetical protein [Actinomycetota bacterium]
MPADPVAVASATFNLAKDCAPDVTGFQTTLTGIVPDSVGGTVTVTVQVPGGNPVNLVTANPYGRTVNGTDPAWITPGQVTIPNGPIQRMPPGCQPRQALSTYP